jgi:hypothetical protein
MPYEAEYRVDPVHLGNFNVVHPSLPFLILQTRDPWATSWSFSLHRFIYIPAELIYFDLSQSISQSVNPVNK